MTPADDPYDRYIESMRSEGLLDEGDRGAAYICDRCRLEGDAPASPTSEHIFCGGRMVPKPHATGSPMVGLPTPEPCECEAKHRPGILNLCACECHQASALTYASFMKTAAKIAGRRHIA